MCAMFPGGPRPDGGQGEHGHCSRDRNCEGNRQEVLVDKRSGPGAVQVPSRGGRRYHWLGSGPVLSILAHALRQPQSRAFVALNSAFLLAKPNTVPLESLIHWLDTPASYPPAPLIWLCAQGCLGMKLGEERELVIPAHEGYGANGFPAWGIPAGGTLNFTIEVLKIE